jgi:predicted small lipoprotein YifL
MIKYTLIIFSGAVMSKSISKSTIATVLCCLTYTVLAGCGTKGPLYIPEQRYPQEADGQKDSGQEAPKVKPQSSPEAKTPTY